MKNTTTGRQLRKKTEEEKNGMYGDRPLDPLLAKLTRNHNIFWQFCIDVCSKRFINITLLARRKMPKFPKLKMYLVSLNEPVHEISNNVVCATSKASDQPAHTRSLIRAFACRLNIL